MGKKEYHVLWLIYFDLSRSRGKGRKVPLGLAVNNPTLEDLAKALDSLGLRYEVYVDKRHPRAWFEEARQGYVIVHKTEGLTKTRLLREVAKALAKLRQAPRAT